MQISKSKMMLDHLVVKKMGTKGETLLEAGELDDILRFGTEEIFAESGNAELAKSSEGKEADSGEVTWDKSKYGDIPTVGGIYYDDKAVEELLDRTKEEKEGEGLDQGTKVQNEYLNSFKVASYLVSQGNGTSAEDKESKDPQFWDKLLKERFALTRSGYIANTK